MAEERVIHVEELKVAKACYLAAQKVTEGEFTLKEFVEIVRVVVQAADSVGGGEHLVACLNAVAQLQD